MEDNKPDPDAPRYDLMLGDREEGDIHIGDDVVAHIVERAILEKEGVRLDSRFALADYLPGRERKEHVKGISISRKAEDGSVDIAVSVRMAYGEDMYQLAVQTREHIREAVQKMSRVIVNRVDIRIVGLISERERPAAEQQPVEAADEE
jgi:uncharacterized alkaline shock family protein YloU